MKVKASQRRTLKDQRHHSAGGRRPADKPLSRHKLPDKYDSVLGKTLVACKNCGEYNERDNYKIGRSASSWCRRCREAVTEASCARCKQVKPRAAFYEHAARSIGLSSYCRDCSMASSNESVARFRAQRQALSDAHRVRLPGETPGQCLAYVNLGAWTRAQPALRCSRQAGAGGYCLTHASARERAVGTALRKIVKGNQPFGSERWRILQERSEQRELERAREDAELAALIDAQDADHRYRFRGGSPWITSLDRPMGEDGNSSLVDFVDHGGLLSFGQSHSPDFSDAVCAYVDYQREIDSWAEVAA